MLIFGKTGRKRLGNATLGSYMPLSCYENGRNFYSFPSWPSGIYIDAFFLYNLYILSSLIYLLLNVHISNSILLLNGLTSIDRQ